MLASVATAMSAVTTTSRAVSRFSIRSGRLRMATISAPSLPRFGTRYASHTPPTIRRASSGLPSQ